METKALRVGLAADHGGFLLKELVATSLRASGYDVVDYGAEHLDPTDDYPDFIVPVAKAVAARQVDRAVAICGSGVGASIAANKILGVRAALVHDAFSAHQGVEDDDMNVMCLGGKVIGSALALELIRTFLAAHFSGAERHQRRLAKVKALETRRRRPGVTLEDKCHVSKEEQRKPPENHREAARRAARRPQPEVSWSSPAELRTMRL